MAKISKILYIVTQSEWGGAQHYIFDLATNLPQEKYEVMVAAGGNEELYSKLNKHGIKNYKLKHLIREISPLEDIKAYFEIKKLINELKPDVLHLNSSKAGVIGAIAGKHAKVKKIIYTVHGFVFNEPMSNLQKNIYTFAEKFSARYKDKLICVSEFDRQAGIKNKIAPENKLITINNGIEPIDFLNKVIARQKLDLPPDKIVIGTIANFYETKGLTYLISAAKEITKQFPDIIFRLIGFGQLEKELKLKIRGLNLQNNFFLSKVLDAKKYLNAFDIFVLPSIKEGFPYAILEAMRAGLPIVATKVGGIPEMLKNETNGLLVEPFSPSDLATKITRLLKDNVLAVKIGRQAKIDVENYFSLEKMVERTKKIYSE